VQFFWGSFDLTVSRFNGQKAALPPHADVITREAYSHKDISVGFWPGSGKFLEPAFYAYTWPEPAGLADAAIKPAGAYYDKDLGEFVFPYERMRETDSPRESLLAFAQTTYEAGANLAKWDRAALER
jgi:hypothetical protein